MFKKSTLQLFLFFCTPGLGCFPAQAATGLSSLAFFSWIAYFLMLCALVGLIVLAVAVIKKLNRDPAEKRPEDKIVTVVLTILSLLITPLFLTAISLDETHPIMTFVGIYYAALLAVTLLDYGGNWKLASAVAVFVAGAFFLRAEGIVSLTAYDLVENRLFSPTHQVAERMGSQFIRTDDGSLFQLLTEPLPPSSKLPVGTRLKVVPQSEKSTGGAYRLHAYTTSREYLRFQQKISRPLIVIPLNRHRINRYMALNLGLADRLDDSDWRAEEQ